MENHDRLKPGPDTTGTILDSIADGVFTVDHEWRITSFNRAAEEITGIPREVAIGQRCCDVFRASICESACALRSTFETGKPVVNKAIYIINPDGRQVPISISTALLKDEKGQIIGGVETFRDLSAVEELRRQLDERYSFRDIISKNHEMLYIFDVLPEIAESDSTVLIEGESGTGKELIARAIHDLSHRREQPMVTVNCGALPDTLLESELFGYKKGAFTDAKDDKPGRFALAHKGTIFLDEISDVSPAMQVRLLRVIQERTYEPLGGTEPLEADVRVITAANRDLQRLVKAGKFRDDLFYRINVIRLKLPPLRRRKEDIPLLIDHFIERFNRTKRKLISGVSEEVLSILMGYNYPGNVRELENIVEHAFVLSRGDIITAENLPEGLRKIPTPVPGSLSSLESLEAEYIRQVLRKNDWNRTRSAAELGVHKTTLWRKMKKLGLDKAKE